MPDSKPISFPRASTNNLSRHDGFPLMDGIVYRSIVGALQYYTPTQPDISFVVNKVC